MNVQLDYTIPYESEWHKYDNHCQAIGKGFTEKHNDKLRSNYCFLRYQIAVYGIFVERLLNRKWQLKKCNIDMETTVLTNMIESFFNNWMAVREQNKDTTSVSERDSFLFQ